MAWNENATRTRVRDAWKKSENVEIKPLVRETSLENIPLQTAYMVDGVHVYLDIPNARALLGDDGEQSQAKFLRFLHVLMRVSHLVFQRTDAIKIDLQSTRLHFVVYKPYDSEASRVQAAVAIAALLRDALLDGNALHAELPDARAVIGIESGKALAVRNGTRGDREPLFLGNPANHAAKLTGVDKAAGLYLGHVARAALGSSYAVEDPSKTPLTGAQIEACAKAAALGVTREALAKAWDEERKKTPVAEFQFSRFAPPLAGFDLDQLSPANSKRQDLVVLYADIDGFTRYVAAELAAGRGAEAVRVLHVIRKELRDILNDFGGKKVRYVGDCVHGLEVEGTSQTTDAEASVTTTVTCAASMRSAFAVIKSEIAASRSLELQVGLELGPTAVTRVGVAGSRDRCTAGKATLEAERSQGECRGGETAIGPTAYAAASATIREAFGPARKSTEIDYDRIVARLERAKRGDGHRYQTGPAQADATRPRAHNR